jgi:hypothetical protein
MTDTNTAVLDQDAPIANEPQTDAPEQNDEQVADAPVVEPVQEAKVAKASADRYPAEEIGEALGKRLKAAHEAGWTRPKITQLVAQVKRVEHDDDVDGAKVPDTFELVAEGGDGVFMGGSALWRSRDGRVHVDEVPYLTAVLDAIDAGDVQLPAKATKDAGKLQERLDALQARVVAAESLLEEAATAKRADDVRQGVAAALEALKA